MNRTFVAFASPYSSVKAWIAALDRLAPLNPVRVVPSHGDMGGASLIAAQRDVLSVVQSRTAALKSEGKSADEAAEVVSKELQAKYPDWANGSRVGPAVKASYDGR